MFKLYGEELMNIKLLLISASDRVFEDRDEPEPAALASLFSGARGTARLMPGGGGKPAAWPTRRGFLCVI